MLNNPTVEKLKDLKLKVMAQMLSDPDHSLRELSFELFSPLKNLEKTRLIC